MTAGTVSRELWFAPTGLIASPCASTRLSSFQVSRETGVIIHSRIMPLGSGASPSLAFCPLVTLRLSVVLVVDERANIRPSCQSILPVSQRFVLTI